MNFAQKKLTIEDILQNPHKYGAPTYEEFLVMREKWVRRPDEAMTKLTEGPTQFRKELKAIKYSFMGLSLSSEEAVEKALGDHGYSLDDIDPTNSHARLKTDMQQIPVGGGLDYEVHVNFSPR